MHLQLKNYCSNLEWTRKRRNKKETYRILVDEDDFEAAFGSGVEEDILWKLRDFSELKSRIQQRQQPTEPIGCRRIKFLHNLPTTIDLYAPTRLTWKGNASITGKRLEKLRVKKLKAKKGNGKAQQ